MKKEKVVESDFGSLDTTKYCLHHRIFGGLFNKYKNKRILLVINIWLIVIAVTLLPLSLIAWLDLPTLTQKSSQLKLPFLYDYNMLFLFAVSLPMLVFYSVTDQSLLVDALNKTIESGVIQIQPDKAADLVDSWNSHFKIFNVVHQLIGLIIGTIAVVVNYIMWSNPEVGFWILKDNKFSVTGWIYLYCVFLFYFIVIIYILRVWSESSFLRDLVKYAKINLEPFHYDNCCGLALIGKLGLRHQYLLTAIGINLMIFYFYNLSLLGSSLSIDIIILVLVAAYLVLGPFVFFSPLIPFRKAMIKFKSDLLHDFARQLKDELEKLRPKIESKEETELIERIRNIMNLIRELPVWPFDISTIKKFLAAYGTPVVVSLIIPLLKTYLF